MGLSLAVYLALLSTGSQLLWGRQARQPRPPLLRTVHLGLGFALVALVFLLLGIGVVGTLGHYGTLGHSWHLTFGLAVVSLVVVSAASALSIHPSRPWARPTHLVINGLILLTLMGVSWTGWGVVQKYLP